MKFEVIKLHFKTPLHLGKGSEEMEQSEVVYHSDSLKSAIYATGISLFDNWKDADTFFNVFRISSCFPFAGKELFFPKPNLRQKVTFTKTPEDLTAKKSKKIEFITHSLFEKYLSREFDEIEIEDGLVTQDQVFVCGTPDIASKDFFKREIQQRVAIPKENEDKDSQPFYIDRIYFNKNNGLYFLAEFNDQEIKEQVLKTLEILGDHGIGTDRTVGNGLFKPTLIDEKLQFGHGSNSGHQMPLGLYLPTRTELDTIDFDNSFWNLLKRGGYMGGSSHEDKMHLRKKSIYMFGEGSVFKSREKLKGKYVDLKPDWEQPIHPVWRCGMPLIINF